ncbi:MAG TPA: hypothetical protein VK968_18010 [Roseimicrobium sp.]|nr:hypothetical protein [Roseimicrobium sp.]
MFQPNGCVGCEFVFAGSCMGKLGYGINMVGGRDNTFRAVAGSRCRHVFTTGVPTIPDTASERARIELYGAVKDSKVIDGLAFSSTNVPYDDHEGARRTVFINCTAHAGITGSNDHRTAFQLRGTDTRIINPNVDESFQAAVGFGEASRGVHTIIGGTIRTMPLRNGEDTDVRPTIEFSSVNVVCPASTEGLFAGSMGRIILTGGTYRVTGAVTAAAFLHVKNGRQFQLNGPEFINEGDSESFRPFHFTEAGQVVGHCTMRRRSAGGDFQSIARSNVAGGTGAILGVKVDWVEGTRPASNLRSGLFQTGRLEFCDYTGTYFEVVTPAVINTIAVAAQSATAIALTSSTTETTLVTVTIPAGMMTGSGSLLVTTLWSCTNNANAKTARVRFGGTQFMYLPLASMASARMQTQIFNRGSGSQISAPGNLSFGTSVGSLPTGSIDTTIDQNVTITGTLANGADTMTLEAYTVQILRT